MFEGLGNLGNMAQMLKQAGQMKQKAAEIQEELSKEEVKASAGGGMVEVVMSGSQEVRSIKIDPVAVDPNDLTMLEDLIVAATNEARKRAQELAQERMGQLFGGLDIDLSKIPGLNL